MWGNRMTWLDLTENWSRSYALLRAKFPKLEQSAMPFLKQDQSRFESYLAATHDLTLDEARNSFDTFLDELAKSKDAELLAAR